MDRNGTIIGMIIFMLAVGFFCGMEGYNLGVNRPTDRAQQIIRCQLTCELRKEKLILVAMPVPPNVDGECICEKSRTYPLGLECK